MLHIICVAQWGLVAVDPWQHTLGYVVWFYTVSHPLMQPPFEGAHAPPPRSTNHEIIIEKDHARDRHSTLHTIHDYVNMVNGVFCDG
jgi:hypothetical protein